MILLKRVVLLLKDKGYDVNNIDAVVVAQRPKIAPYIQRMQTNIASVLGVDEDCVNIKATTTEKLGFEGRQEGISAQAVCTIIKR